MRKVGGLILVALVAAFLGALPAFGAKAPLTDDDLDGITAAGQPKVIQVEAESDDDDVDVDIDLTDEETAELSITGSAQESLRALTVNNVVGENTVANAMNIAAVFNFSAPSDQSNEINQSWGSTKDIGFVFPGEAEADSGADKCIGSGACRAN